MDLKIHLFTTNLYDWDLQYLLLNLVSIVKITITLKISIGDPVYNIVYLTGAFHMTKRPCTPANFRKISERLNGRWAFKIHFRSISVNDCIGTIDRALHEKYLTR